MEKIDILGVSLNPVNMSESLDIIETFIKEKTPHLVVTLGTEMTMMAQKDKELKDVINNTHLVVPDTAGIVWSASVLHGKKIKKVAGIDLLQKLAERGSQKGYTFYFLGSQEGVAEKAAQNLRELYHSLNITGTHHGYFRGKDKEVIEEIKKAKPDILIIAMGVPSQEKWAYKNLEILDVPVSIGVGGSFDVLSGKLDRAPAWMIKLNIEWLYRLYREPSRFMRMMVLPHFVILVLKKKFFG
ncbi:MAG: WecB/TagA/CpsF family glycosyltransferase [Candidatus Eremiobacterota bacterium]